MKREKNQWYHYRKKDYLHGEGKCTIGEHLIREGIYLKTGLKCTSEIEIFNLEYYNEYIKVRA